LKSAALVTTGFLIMGLGNLGAASFTCPDTTACNGNLYQVTTQAVGMNLFDITVSVDTTNYNGTPAPYGLGAIGIKSFTSSTFQIMGFTANGGNNSPAWTLQESELSASDGCGNLPGSGTSRFCAENVGPYLFDKGDLLNFKFSVQVAAGGTINNTIHLKYLFLERDIDNGTNVSGNEYIDDWNKEGSLGSFNITNSGDILRPALETSLPEPSTFALIGGALLLLPALRKRF